MCKIMIEAGADIWATPLKGDLTGRTRPQIAAAQGKDPQGFKRDGRAHFGKGKDGKEYEGATICGGHGH